MKRAHCGLVGLSFVPSAKFSYFIGSYLQFQKGFEIIIKQHNNNINHPSFRSQMYLHTLITGFGTVKKLQCRESKHQRIIDTELSIALARRTQDWHKLTATAVYSDISNCEPLNFTILTVHRTVTTEILFCFAVPPALWNEDIAVVDLKKTRLWIGLKNRNYELWRAQQIICIE